MKNWIEQFLNVQVEGINSSRIRAKKKNRSNSHYTSKKKMITRLRANYFIPLFVN